MSTKNDVLSILERSRNRFISGQELAERLDISRTAVWKAVKTLEGQGHRITSVKNRGYMLESDSDLLSEEGVRLALPEPFSSCPILLCKSVDSTNTLAKRLALDGASHGTIVLAEEQTAGRGRRGKSFFSPPGTGLYMSIILRPERDVQEPQMITVAAAVAVCNAVEKLTGRSPSIKWVNDVYLEGKKICGILTEAITDYESSGIDCIVVGAGINCRTPSAVPEELQDVVGFLDMDGLSRNRLAAETAAGILRGLETLNDPKLTEEYKNRSMMTGKSISFLRDGGTVQAVVLGLDDRCGLMVRLEDGSTMTLTGGEVSIEKF